MIQILSIKQKNSQAKRVNKNDLICLTISLIHIQLKFQKFKRKYKIVGLVFNYAFISLLKKFLNYLTIRVVQMVTDLLCLNIRFSAHI